MCKRSRFNVPCRLKIGIIKGFENLERLSDSLSKTDRSRSKAQFAPDLYLIHIMPSHLSLNNRSLISYPQGRCRRAEEKKGYVNASDSLFGSRLIWQDANTNGITNADELNTLSAFGISSLNASYRSTTRDWCLF
jgi:hypothetical protein